MAIDSKKTLRNKLIYEVYVRNHKGNGTFKDVIDDLDRMKELGVDIVWFMPIHPIGQKNKKGDMGCPYSIADFTKVNPEYGTEEDFKETINEIHKRDMLCMIDIVFNHTSHDAKYLQEHPEYYYRKPDGNLGGKVADWSDITDLDYNNKDLWGDQIEALKKWSGIGVDGFRCDVAPFIPMDFWMRARREIGEINKDTVWLAETVHPHFLQMVRNAGFYVASDCETYSAFDITYDYDGQEKWMQYLMGEIPLNEYLNVLRSQESTNPDNYVKLRFVENHDNPRAKKIISNDILLENWTSFMYFQKGCPMLYAGQEMKDSNLPDLFTKDMVNWNEGEEDFVDFLKTLGKIKKDDIFADGMYKVCRASVDGVIYAAYKKGERTLVGIFNVEGKIGELSLKDREHHQIFELDIKDGFYEELIYGEKIEVKDGRINLSQKPVIFEVL
ncbi:alpha-amylase family glycosyl hydrolase [Oceanirhabdus seepicola]|uniref:Alpha-amylase n=1 Tax=Oceanirhabdus seepicola TaxID=2828781 RepID=A0A9J6PBG9_9CLOT|nr:alpha-amylase family glycosyl hydrolase [Oceanirhabdus seepicola]MCM1992525.1 alpha-amylase [Oceanirhabdus seepicola]